jgi:hypothetical protein
MVPRRAPGQSASFRFFSDSDAVPSHSSDGVNARVQAEQSRASTRVRQARWLPLDLPPPSTIPIRTEAAEDDVADDQIAHDTSSEDEDYEYVDNDDDDGDQTQQQREDEDNAYATVERGNNIEEPTPIEIESALRALDQSSISNPSDLVREVRKRSEFHGERLDGLDATVIFVSESTGPSRTRQRFRCSNCDCEAHVSFTIRDNIVRFMEAEFVHNHHLSDVTSKRAPLLTLERREEIQYLTSIGCYAGHIRLQLGLSIPRQTLYNARRIQPRQYRSNQAAALETQIPTYDDYHTRLLRDDNRLAGCYFFQNRFTDTTICTETVIMDDTSCANRYNFPIPVILGIDEHTLSQLVAFALTRNRIIQVFVHFLSCVKQCLCAENRDLQSTKVLKAFVVNRHDGQFGSATSISRVERCVLREAPGRE